MTKTKIWLQAARLRTLPLAFATIILGSFLAKYHQSHKMDITLLAFLTTLFLQILSNFSNDFGDTQHGADSTEREGPKRAVQQGLITENKMKLAMILFSILSFVSGLALIHISFVFASVNYFVFLFLLLITIYASINYTSGKSPYGYKALGDISVLIFFGIFGVALSAYLHLQYWNWTLVLPAISVGLLATAVLNLNNMRDCISDKKAGKNTMAIIFGFKNSKVYHYFLLYLPFLFSLSFVYYFGDPKNYFSYLFLILLPFIVKQSIVISKIENPQEYDKWLKPTAILTLAFCILLGLGINIHYFG